MISHPIDPLPQSSGHVLPGGDCGYCCVAGLFGLPSILSAYEHVEAQTGRARHCMNAFTLESYLSQRGCEFQEYWPDFERYKTGCHNVPWENLAWIDGIERLLGERKVLIGSIAFERRVPVPPRGGTSATNHQVLLVGYRERWEELPGFPDTKRQCREVEMACSVRGRYWIEWSELLYWHQASPMFWVQLP